MGLGPSLGGWGSVGKEAWITLHGEKERLWSSEVTHEVERVQGWEGIPPESHKSDHEVENQGGLKPTMPSSQEARSQGGTRVMFAGSWASSWAESPKHLSDCPRSQYGLKQARLLLQ